MAGEGEGDGLGVIGQQEFNGDEGGRVAAREKRESVDLRDFGLAVQGEGQFLDCLQAHGALVKE